VLTGIDRSAVEAMTRQLIGIKDNLRLAISERAQHGNGEEQRYG
jgi:hypothetical protein